VYTVGFRRIAPEHQPKRREQMLHFLVAGLDLENTAESIRWG